ncbi:MAG: hypothetical protein RR595_02615 [Lysinibacillus sp.]
MDEHKKHHFREMTEVKRVVGAKEETWKKIENSVTKKDKRYQIQYRLVSIATFAVLLFLIGITWAKDSYPGEQNGTASSVGEPNITDVYYSDLSSEDDFLAKDSNMYLKTQKFERANYKDLQNNLSELQKLTPTKEILNRISPERDFLIRFDNGDTLRLKSWHLSSEEYAYVMQDWDTKQFYGLQKDVITNDFYYKYTNNKKITKSNIIDVLLVSMLLLELFLRKKYGSPKKMKFYPNKRYFILDCSIYGLSFILLLLAMFKVFFVHVAVIVCICVIGFLYLCYLERIMPPLKGRMLFRLSRFIIVYWFWLIISNLW